MYYLNGIWEKEYPLDLIKISFIVILGLAFVALTYKLIKSPLLGKIRPLLSLVLFAYLGHFILTKDTSDDRAYYLMAILMFLGAFLDIIQSCIKTKRASFSSQDIKLK